MPQLDDFSLGPERNASAPSLRREETWRLWAIAGVLIAFIAAAVAFFVLRPSSESTTSTTKPAASNAASEAAAPTRPLGADVEPRELPPLDLTDPVVRELLRGLSARPELAAWLATDGLVRNLVATVDSVANGNSPSSHLRRLAPSRPFAAEAQGEAFVIDPRSYERYDGIADTVASLDAAGLAQAYTTFRPRLDEAYRELGYPDGSFDAAVERALGRLLSTPIPTEDIAVSPAPVLYKFADERLERLAPAQKQLVRMGPRNARLVQDKLREVGLALGVPVDRLPTR
jgi:hypothetical protein